jgi:hypothetical protein
MTAIHISPDFNWSAHREFLIYGTDGELLGETGSMSDALRMVKGNKGLHVVTWTEDEYPVTIAPL